MTHKNWGVLYWERDRYRKGSPPNQKERSPHEKETRPNLVVQGLVVTIDLPCLDERPRHGALERRIAPLHEVVNEVSPVLRRVLDLDIPTDLTIQARDARGDEVGDERSSSNVCHTRERIGHSRLDYKKKI
jgi:hypothetical protein